jgi:uncharacterized protein (TIGR02145 family)
MKTILVSILFAALGVLFLSGCKKDNDSVDNQPKIIVQPDQPLTDIDGNVYATVKIGQQVWMAENLRVTHNRQGSLLTPIQLGSQWAANLTQAAYCYYNNRSDSATVYGALYNGKAVTGSTALAPTGWRIPTAADLTQLRVYLESFKLDDACLKEAGYSHWLSPNTGGTNSVLFNALPGGYRFADGSFRLKGYQGRWWLNDGTNSFLLLYDQSIMQTSTGTSQLGYAVRCIKE